MHFLAADEDDRVSGPFASKPAAKGDAATNGDDLWSSFAAAGGVYATTTPPTRGAALGGDTADGVQLRGGSIADDNAQSLPQSLPAAGTAILGVGGSVEMAYLMTYLGPPPAYGVVPNGVATTVAADAEPSPGRLRGSPAPAAAKHHQNKYSPGQPGSGPRQAGVMCSAKPGVPTFPSSPSHTHSAPSPVTDAAPSPQTPLPAFATLDEALTVIGTKQVPSFTSVPLVDLDPRSNAPQRPPFIAEMKATQVFIGQLPNFLNVDRLTAAIDRMLGWTDEPQPLLVMVVRPQSANQAAHAIITIEVKQLKVVLTLGRRAYFTEHMLHYAASPNDTPAFQRVVSRALNASPEKMLARACVVVEQVNRPKTTTPPTGSPTPPGGPMSSPGSNVNTGGWSVHHGASQRGAAAGAGGGSSGQHSAAARRGGGGATSHQAPNGLRTSPNTVGTSPGSLGPPPPPPPYAAAGSPPSILIPPPGRFAMVSAWPVAPPPGYIASAAPIPTATAAVYQHRHLGDDGSYRPIDYSGVVLLPSHVTMHTQSLATQQQQLGYGGPPHTGPAGPPPGW